MGMYAAACMQCILIVFCIHDSVQYIPAIPATPAAVSPAANPVESYNIVTQAMVLWISIMDEHYAAVHTAVHVLCNSVVQ
jgi:hypothetical protein